MVAVKQVFEAVRGRAKPGGIRNSERTGLLMSSSLTRYAIVLPLVIAAGLLAFYLLTFPSAVQSSSAETLDRSPQLTTEVCHDTVSLTPDGLGPAGIAIFRIFTPRGLVATADDARNGASYQPSLQDDEYGPAQYLRNQSGPEDPFSQ